MRNTLLFFAIFISSLSCYCQELVQLVPISESIILVHFDEGFAVKHAQGESTNNEFIVHTPLNVENASNTNSYQVSSSTDLNYQTPMQPINVFRKTKGTDFINICEGFGPIEEYGIDGCINNSPDHAKEHWIYLELNLPLQTGQEYTVEINGYTYTALVPLTFTFMDNANITPSIHVNNLGYQYDSNAKYGYVYQWSGDGGSVDFSFLENNEFQLIDIQNNAVVYSGLVEFRKDELTMETFQNNSSETPNQNFNGSQVYECNFSDFDQIGEYQLIVEGVGASYPFEISCDAIRPAFHAVMNALTKNRSGITLTSPVVVNERPAPHNPNTTPGFSDKLKYTTTTLCAVSDPDADPSDKTTWEAGIVGDLESWGWYQDAGDWDAYPAHMDVATKLMFLYDQFPENFADGQLLLPENDNGIPDILDEARWLPRFYKRLKDECEEKNYTTGGVPGARIFADLWGEDAPDGVGIGSWQDNERWWIVSGEDIFQTFLYAGACAQLALVHNKFGIEDPEEIDWATEAIDAFAWANESYDPAITCHDQSLAAKKNYASAGLLMLTGNSFYNDEFISSLSEINVPSLDEYSDIFAYGGMIYSFGNPDLTNANTLAEVKNLLEITADFQLLNNIDLRACRFGGNHYFPMLSGHGTTPYIFSGIIGYALLKDTNPDKAASYLSSIQTTADYFLGTNPLNMTWVMGVGDKSPEGVFHIDSWYTENTYGYIPYGPWKQDEVFVMGPFHHQWAEKTQYPEPNAWPGHERWFNQTESPLSTEFTIYQNLVNAAALYGVLSGPSDCTETIVNISEKYSDNKSHVRIYPNPLDNQGIIDFTLERRSKIIIKIHDQMGKLVSNQKCSTLNMGKQVLSFSTSHLQKGLYTLSIFSNEQPFVSKKIIIQH